MRSKDTQTIGEYLAVRQVAALLGVSIRTVWKMTSIGTLPPPIYLTPRCPRWIRSAVVERIASLAN